MNRRISLSLYLSLAFLIVSAANGTLLAGDLEAYHRDRQRITRTGMTVLGSWAAGNFAVSGIMLGSAEGQEKYFHIMNIGWNGVNALIAGSSLYSTSTEDTTEMDLSQSIQGHHAFERALFLNIGLDAAWIMTGLYMVEKSEGSRDRDMLKGFGYSLILQGGFLMVFDIALYSFLHRRGSVLYDLCGRMRVTSNSIYFIQRF